MRNVVKIIMGPCITDEDTVGRLAKFDDGKLEVQSYFPGEGWIPGGTDIVSMSHAGAANERTLLRMGYSAEEIAKILADPTQ